ncbi:hypothetical protein CCE01nite_15670 [Cellulomonas cellasea]|uniref:Uncharacterized protein n=1 Tax=Cellulomonas cellasea TaxID=43670 RepID=A0A4Y3KXP9_9CELL|nr:hypothetical protein CCE01nite_15670 [Cellulomonas cellasea]
MAAAWAGDAVRAASAAVARAATARRRTAVLRGITGDVLRVGADRGSTRDGSCFIVVSTAQAGNRSIGRNRTDRSARFHPIGGRRAHRTRAGDQLSVVSGSDRTRHRALMGRRLPVDAM